MKGIETIGPQYEEFGARLIDFIVNKTMLHRGLNPHGHPVGHTIDSVSETGDVAAEYSAEQSYFEPRYSKIFKDLRHSRTAHPQAKRILLLSSRECGPKAHKQLVNLCSRLKRWMKIEVEVFDSRRQAEHIVDDLLLNDLAIEALSPYLAPLDKVRIESAATHLMPKLSVGYLPRIGLEILLAQAIRKERVAAVAGMGGSGKSECVVAVANELSADFEMVVWVPATSIRSTNDLQAITIDRRGHRLNVLHLLNERSCLVILDDMRIGVSVAELKHYCGDNSAILVTRQTAVDGDVRMPLLDRDAARTLLEQGLPNKCPDDVFEVVWGTVGGHPLAMRLMNAGVRNGSWDELPRDCAAIGQYPDEDRMQRLADRLLARLERTLEKELAFYVWCDSNRVDRTFARRVLASVGIRKLNEACFLAADRDDIVRIHDIIYVAIRSLQIPVERYSAEFDNALENHVKGLASSTSSSLAFLNFCHIHSAKLEALLRINPNRSTCLYCLTHIWTDQDVDLLLVGDPVARAKIINSAQTPSDIDVCAVCEAIEAIYRKTKYDSGIELARAELEHNLEAFALVASTPGISGYGRRTAIHHRAKALRNLKRYGEAISMCRSILAELDSPATKLLLARLLVFDKNEIEQAKNLLFELLNTAQASPETAEISVTLAAIETLGRWQLKQWFRQALETFGDLVTNYIIESAARGLDQAFDAFASIGRELCYNDEELFVGVFKQLPRRTPEDVRDDRGRSAWGDILLTASKSSTLNRSAELVSDAIRFYEAIEKPDLFSRQQRGQALILLNRYEDALNILKPLTDTEPNPWSRYWLSKALVGLKQLPAALHQITEAIGDPKAKGYLAAFLEHRWEIRKANNDPAAIEDLQNAYSVCKDLKHRVSLSSKLAVESLQKRS